jgi:SnoaL-like domain
MERFRRAVEAMDADAIVATLAEDIVFQSPIVFRPYRGRGEVSTVLRAAATVFKDFRYEDELRSERQTALHFTARVGDKKVEGVDLGELDEDGFVKRLTVFVRPLSGALALAEAMRAILTKGS